MPKAQASPELWLIGGGRMGSALLSGWAEAGLISRRRGAHVVEPAPSPVLKALARNGMIRLEKPPFHPRAERLICLAVKPQSMAEAVAAAEPLFSRECYVLSIMAGRSIKGIAAATGVPANRIVRAMPNTPAAIGRGATGMTALARGAALGRLKALMTPLLAAVGDVVWVRSETEIDAVTALSGSGPAYVFLLAEVLSEAGMKAGLSRSAAERLARATVAGAGALLEGSSESPKDLREAVTSPKGTTAAALEILMGEGALAELIGRAVEAARLRAGELANA